MGAAKEAAIKTAVTYATNALDELSESRYFWTILIKNSVVDDHEFRGCVSVFPTKILPSAKRSAMLWWKLVLLDYFLAGWLVGLWGREKVCQKMFEQSWNGKGRGLYIPPYPMLHSPPKPTVTNIDRMKNQGSNTALVPYSCTTEVARQFLRIKEDA